MFLRTMLGIPREMGAVVGLHCVRGAAFKLFFVAFPLFYDAGLRLGISAKAAGRSPSALPSRLGTRAQRRRSPPPAGLAPARRVGVGPPRTARSPSSPGFSF